MGFSTKECAFKHVTVEMLGRKFVGLQGYSFQKKVSKEYLYGAGSDPIDIQVGNKEYPGNLELLKYEVDMLNEAAQAAGFEDITEVPHEAITITVVYKKNAADAAKKLVSYGVAFMDIDNNMKQGAKQTNITLPFLAMKTILNAP